MNLTQIAGVTLAVLLVATGAAAALPGNAPVDAPVEQADNSTDTNETEEDADEDRQGPPSEMPSQAPSFVSDIHDLIRGKLDGSISNLGEQISSLTPGGDAGQPGNAGNAPADGPPGR
ncbi:MAG: hypothetical protein V5A39_08975 [Haloarculaceae archaeon]